MVSLLDKMTIWKERILRNIPLWATLFMISVMVFVDIVLLNRPHFLISAIPILIFVILGLVIAFIRHSYYSKEGSTR